jgi:putative heme-binding domain-containing protein
LADFKKELEGFIKHTLAQKYNTRGAPQLVLFSPIAHEDLKSPNLPDGKENNARLELYTKAMAEVAAANRILFVDLFSPTKELYAKEGKPLTINGVHLNELGNRRVAEIIDRALFAGQPDPKREPATLEKLRQAVLDKNFHWFNRYRTTDGYSIYGGRADLRFVNGQTNREVMQREMEVLDVMTANRDKRIWSVAAGGDAKVDDRNTPPFVPVITNKPGPLEGGKHFHVDGEKAIEKMTLGKGLKINLFASEKDFPDLLNPVQMSFDPQGRLWVATWPSYPHWKPKDEMSDKLLVLEDTNGDGKADKCTPFAENLHNPTGFEFWNGGVLVAMAPDLLFLKDTNGDGKADVRIRVLSGLCSADTHHTSNSFVFDAGGALYFQEGTFHHSQVESPWGPSERCANAGVFRFEPRTAKFEVYVSYSFANPHGHVFDRWGQDIVIDGTGANPYHGALFSGKIHFPQKHARPPQVYQQKTRPCPGMEYLYSRHFPDDFQGNLLVGNVIGFHGILRYKIEDRDASFAGVELEPVVSSTDPNFRPSDMKIGPDGAIYFTDWQKPIIGHMQHNLRDPSRTREHGRVYRITHENRPLLKPVKVAGEPIDKLLDLLKEPEDRVRYRARIELGNRDTKQVVDAAAQWLNRLTPKDADFEHHRLEALWLHQNHNVVHAPLLDQVLKSRDFRARAAAVRVLCYWRDRVSGALDLLKQAANDPHPRVRLEAVRAASFFTEPEALEIVLISLDRPTDLYLDFVRQETMKVLEPVVKKAIAEKREIKFTSEAGARYFLKSVGTEELLTMKRSRPVYLELLFRAGVRDEFRREALAGLSQLEKQPELNVLLRAIESHDQASAAREESVVFDLARLLTSRPAAELAKVRPELEKMAADATSSVTRQLGFVALIAADGGTDKAWALGLKSVPALVDLVNAMPLIRDPGHRASLYPRIEPLLFGLPKELSSAATNGKEVRGRYVRVELPGKVKTLTLAEVEVISDGKNIARQGKATQKNTAHGGDASRGIDGNTSGSYGDGGQTHCQEGTQDPWWEVDLGAEVSISSIVVWNRTDGNFGNRLGGFTLKVLDRDRKTVYERAKQPAPPRKVSFDAGTASPEGVVRRAGMIALTTVRGEEAKAFKTLAAFVQKDTDRHAAVQAILRIPATHWPAEEAKALLDPLLASIRKLPPQERTTPFALDAMQLGYALSALLPRDVAKVIRKELGELGVRVLRLGTVPDQMIYDQERLVVQAGKPVEIQLENTDLMPHNWVLVQPGALEEVGNLAEESATKSGALERHYVPASAKIIQASRLLQPRELQKLSFAAPTKPGVYPYVCTYPGHWRRMHGALYVVQDLEEYLADPEAYLAKNPLPVSDELLKFNRPRKEWTYAELSPLIEKMEAGRSFANGKQMFKVATCIACHKLNGEGVELGPDLAKPDPKFKPADILREIVEPSHRINEKFQSFVIELKSGTILKGLVIAETPDELKLVENPLAKADALTIKTRDIRQKKPLETSIMPKGLLDKLTRDEILDLWAYVLSGGNAQHPLFKGGHEHHKH